MFIPGSRNRLSSFDHGTLGEGPRDSGAPQIVFWGKNGGSQEFPESGASTLGVVDAGTGRGDDTTMSECF